MQLASLAMLNETFFVIFKHCVSISFSSFQLACVFELLEGSHVSATPPRKKEGRLKGRRKNCLLSLHQREFVSRRMATVKTESLLLCWHTESKSFSLSKNFLSGVPTKVHYSNFVFVILLLLIQVTFIYNIKVYFDVKRQVVDVSSKYDYLDSSVITSFFKSTLILWTSSFGFWPQCVLRSVEKILEAKRLQQSVRW